MTIAAGFVCADGMVMCADGQETAGKFKCPTDKLTEFIADGCPVIIAGAGLGHVVDVAVKRIRQGMESDPAVLNSAAQMSGLTEVVLRGIAESEFPCPPTLELMPELLIGLRTQNREIKLYQTMGTLLKPVDAVYSIIGDGIFTKVFAEGIYGKNVSSRKHPVVAVSETRVFAAWLAWVAKRQLSFVGDPTRILSFGKDGGFSSVTENEITRLEETFAWHENESGRLMLACCDAAIPESDFSTRVESFAAQVRNRKKQLA